MNAVYLRIFPWVSRELGSPLFVSPKSRPGRQREVKARGNADAGEEVTAQFNASHHGISAHLFGKHGRHHTLSDLFYRLEC